MILDNGVKTTQANDKDKRPFLSLIGARSESSVLLAWWICSSAHVSCSCLIVWNNSRDTEIILNRNQTLQASQVKVQDQNRSCPVSQCEKSVSSWSHRFSMNTPYSPLPFSSVMLFKVGTCFLSHEAFSSTQPPFGELVLLSFFIFSSYLCIHYAAEVAFSSLSTCRPKKSD